MASLESRLSDLATRVGSEFKSLRTLVNGNVADLANLVTSAKSSVVAAINEVKTQANATAATVSAFIDDSSTTATDHVWSVFKTKSYVDAAVTALIGGAGSAYDTLKEIQTILENDATSVTAIFTALSKRVAVDAAQSFSNTEKQQARDNIDVYSRAEIGDPNTDLVAIFESALV